MSFARHPDFKIQRLTIGAERQPLLVIDNFFADPDQVVQQAVGKSFGYVSNSYPGVRTKVPLSLQQFVLGEVRAECAQTFGMQKAVIFTSCHFSLVTTPPEQLSYLQRVPHIDSTMEGQLAMVLYLFKRDQGGTAFYRHRKSGFEYVNSARREQYYRHLEDEQEGVMQTSKGYIGGDTPFYERIGRQAGVFNRMLMYFRTSLHSADFGPEFEISGDPRRGRLSLNGFLS